MALITCPECGAQVSDKAHTCPKCGHPFVHTERSSAVGGRITAIVIVSIIAFILALFALIGTCNWKSVL